MRLWGLLPQQLEPAAEQQFQAHFGRSAVLLDVGVALMGSCAHAATLLAQARLSGGMLASATAHLHTWVRLFIMLETLLAIAVLGSQRYRAHWRGPASIVHRLLFVLVVPHGGSGVILQRLWRHRLPVVHAATALSHVPAVWYWCGVPLCLLAAVAADLAEPEASACGPSPSCLLGALAALLAQPGLLLQRAATAAAAKAAAVHLAHMMLPGLLFSCYEGSARRAWAAQQHSQPGQQQQRLQVNSRGPAAAALHAGEVAAGTALSQRQASQQAASPPAKPGRKDCSSGSASSCSSSGSAAQPVLAASTGTAATPAAATANPALDRQSPAAATVQPAAGPAAAPGTSCLSPAGRHNPAGSQFLLYQSPVRREFAAVKLQPPAHAGVADLAAVRRQLTQQLYDALAAANALAVDQAHVAAPLLHVQATAFSGCYQLVFQFSVLQQANDNMLLQQAETGPNQQQPLPLTTQALQQQLQQSAEQLVQQQAGWSLLGLPAAALSAPTAAAAGSSATADVSLEPAALALPAATAGCELQATLSIPAAVVEQLCQQGNSSIRVVVARQEPATDPPLLDKTWQLPPGLPAAAAAVAAAAAGKTFEPPAGAAAAAASDASAAAAEGTSDLRLPLRLSLLPQQQRQQQAALTVVVLAGQTLSPAATGSNSTSTRGNTAAAVAAPAASKVVTVLPLLLLTKPAQAELQQLLARVAATAGLSTSQAYNQMLLPLLQDWALLLGLASSASATSSSSSSSTATAQAQQRHSAMQQTLLTFLSGYCITHRLDNCSRLLAAAVAPAAAASSQAQEQEQPAGSCSSNVAQAADAATSSAQAAAAAPAGSSSSAGLWKRKPAGRPLAPADTADAAGELPAPGPQQPQQVLSPEQQQLLLGSFAGCIRLLLLGFPAAATEASFVRFKAAALVGYDGCVAAVYSMALAAGLLRLAKLFGGSVMLLPLLVAGLRCMFMLMHPAVHVAVWLAGRRVVSGSSGPASNPAAVWQQQQQQQQRVQRLPRWVEFIITWRGALIKGGVILQLTVPMLLLASGVPLLENVAVAAVGEYKESFWLLLAYRHIVQPMYSAASVIATAAYLLVVLGPFDALFGQQTLLWFGPAATTLLLAAVHLAVCATFELRMRRAFVAAAAGAVRGGRRGSEEHAGCGTSHVD